MIIKYFEYESYYQTDKMFKKNTKNTLKLLQIKVIYNHLID